MAGVRGSGYRGHTGASCAGHTDCRRALLSVLALCALCLTWRTPAFLIAASPAWTCAEMDAFLRTARIGRLRGLTVGVTLPSRATLDDGTRQHDAAIQTIDIAASVYETAVRTELNFRDTWKFNVAGYELAKQLGLNMVPPYVERRVAGKDAAVSWWVPDTMMERDRLERKIQPPDDTAWNGQIHATRAFHELMGDRDFNATNLLITPEWRVWMIDFTRAFRRVRGLEKAESLVRIDRTLLFRLRTLDADAVRRGLSRWLLAVELDALLARRARLVSHFDGEIARRGEAAVLYDFPRIHEPCGTGLE